MYFRVLGPLTIESETDTGPLRSSRQRTVLAALLLNAGRPVPSSQLIEAIWDHDPPQTAQNQVQICVSQLRRLLRDAMQPHSVLMTTPSGYVLDVARDRIDSLVFNDLLDRADAEEPERAVVNLRKALSLWRGPALSDVLSPALRPAAHYLGEKRLLCLERRIELEMSLGRHDQLIGELRQLIHGHPLREGFYSHLMTALYRSGRQAEALETYRALRSKLNETVGIEPSADLTQLHHAILNQEERLLPARASTARSASGAVVPRQLPPAMSRLVGRERELERILAVVETGKGAGLPVAAVIGPPGAGKTALAVEAAHLLSTRYTDGQLYADTRGLRPFEILGRFLRGLGVSGDDLPVTPAERTGMFRSLTAGRAILVVLDNVDSHDLLRDILPGSTTCAVLLTGPRRPAGLADGQVIGVGPLDVESALDMLVQEVGKDRIDAEPEAAPALADDCARMPLALRIAGARLAAKPRWPIAALRAQLGDNRTLLDELAYGGLEVRASIAGVHAVLSMESRTLLRTLGTRPSCHPAEIVLPALDGAPRAVEELHDFHLIDVRPGACRWNRLVRAFAMEQAAADRACEAQRTDRVDSWI
jgi:DNA-binding SARP family transcriptional activator